MNQGLVNTVVSAIVGGIVGAGVVFFAGNANNKDLANAEMQELKVAKITVTDQLTLLNKEGNPEVVIKDGSILLENVIVAKKVVAKQVQGHALVANRVFATPDDVFTTPMENWRFYAEIGSSHDAGGEIVVRNAAGPASVNRPTNSGALLRMGFDPETRPQVLALNNLNRSPVQINFDLSEMQRQLLSAAGNNQGMMQQIQPGAFDSGSVAPIGTVPSSATLAQPDGSSPIR